MNFREKIVLITGGSSGLGLATAKAFSEQQATVVIAARRLEKLQENFPNFEAQGAHFIPTDFAQMADVTNLFEVIANRFGRLDIAVNNVGASLVKPFLESNEEEFDHILNVNLKSVWLSMQQEFKLMFAHPEAHKHIVNVSSVNGLGGAEYTALYAAAKAGVISLTKSVALEFASRNVSVNVIAPGAFDTPMLQGAIDSLSDGDAEKRQAIEQQYYGFIPQKRFGKPEEFAELILWLCSGKAPYVSGHSFIMDGGMTSRFR